MFHRRRWIVIGFIALSVVAGWRLSFWMPQPIVNAQEAGRAKQRVESKPIDGQGEKSPSLTEHDATMDRDAKHLAARVRTAKEPEKATLRAELEKLTEQHFEQRQQRRETEIAELADRVDKLRVAHHRRQENKPDIIHRRITDLLDAENDLKWDEARLELTDGIYWFAALGRCPPCQRMLPIVKRLQNEGHHIEAIDIDHTLALAQKWKVNFVPTILILSEGKEAHRLEGLQTYEALKLFVARFTPRQVNPTLSNPDQLRSPTMTSVAIQRLRNEFNVLTSELLEKATTLPKDSPEYVSLEGRIAKIQVTLLQQELDRLHNLAGISSPADPEALNKMLWTVVGLKLAKLDGNQELPANQLRKYRGGMRVTDVREGSNAATNKFQKGDILVGLDKWETTSFENIKFVFDQPEVQAARSIKFYILRGSETLYGVIQWNNDEPSIGQFLLNQLTKPAEAKSPNSDDANKQSVTAAIIRAAEARRTLAALEYKRVIAANKQTPGATSNIEIERMKANLEIAEAELDAAKAGGDISRSDKPKPTTDGEPTFDGTAYSQWLKMLESERKPDKLATAIEACTRLAVAGDERRIVRGIFAATKLFEQTDDSKERNRVWDAGVAGLKRLPGMTVAGELLASAQDEKSRINHDFKAYLLISSISPSPASENLRDAVRSHGGELIGMFLEQARVTGENNRHMLSRATSVWLMSGRKLTEFDGFQPQLLKAIDEVYSRTTGRIDRREQPWFSATKRLAETEPETPELAALLAKHIEKDRIQIYDRLSRMGRHAEPAVPRLIEHFLVIWNKRESELRRYAAEDERADAVVSDNNDPFRHELPDSEEERMVQVLNVLAAIGPGAKAAVPLLQQIAVLAPPKRIGGRTSLADKLFDAVQQTLVKIGDVPATAAKDSPVLLSEFTRLQSVWNLMSTKPEVDHKDIQFHFAFGTSIQDKNDHDNFEIVRKIMDQLDAPSGRMYYRINDTTSPRQIDFIYKDHKRTLFGIYELSGNRLKIEIAKTGKPRPKEFSPDKDKLPEGHTLLEFERAPAVESEP